MSEQERLMAKGQLAELKVQAEDLRIEIRGLRDSIRVQLYEFRDVLEIDGQVVAEQAMKLAARLIDYRDVLGQIAAITKALGL